MPELQNVHPIEFAADAGCNVDQATIMAQVAANIRRGLPQAQPHAPHPAQAILLCGGPSLPDHEAQIVAAQWAGGKVIAVNGAYQWCLNRNIRPSAAIVMDARPSNARFVAQPVDGCRYLLASQCHPDVFELCRDRDVTIWHACSGGDEEYAMIAEYYFGRTHPVTIGTTVGIRSISLLRMLGFVHQEIFGLDSCWLDDRHHGYEQAENDSDQRLKVWLRPLGAKGEHRDDKAHGFWCAPWHVKQAQDFMALIKDRGNAFELNVHGPGLIATILRAGAEIQMEG